MIQQTNFHGKQINYRDDEKSDLIIFGDGSYNKFVNRLKKTDVVADLGGHIGSSFLRFSDKCDKVVCLEPENSNFSLCMLNKYMNEIENVTLIQKAVTWHESGVTEFFLTEQTMNHSLKQKKRNKNKGKTVKTNTINLRELFNAYHFNKIKLDIESGEVELIDTFFDVIEQQDEFIFEYHSDVYDDRYGLETYFRIIDKLQSTFKFVKYGNPSSVKTEFKKKTRTFTVGTPYLFNGNTMIHCSNEPF